MNNAQLYYLGHASIRIRTSTGKVIYIDPFAGDDYSVAADIILVTHDHFDHNDTEKVCRKDNCRIITNKEALIDGVYKTFNIDDIKIEAVQAYNKNHKKDEGVGYILSFDDLSLYHAGDTSTTEQMADLHNRKIDYALLPTDGRYNMDVDEASNCAKLIGAKHSIPIHMPKREFSEEIADAFSVNGKIIIKPGETIELIKVRREKNWI